jgi:hypothetical protein
MDQELEEVFTTVSVPKAKALLKSGPRAGKLRKGCRFKGKRVMCTPAVAASIKGLKGKKPKRGKAKHKADFTPKTERGELNLLAMKALRESRSKFKNAADCRTKVSAVREISKVLTYMSKIPSKKGPEAEAKRNVRYRVELQRKINEVASSCGGGGARTAAPSVSTSHADRVIERYRRMRSSAKARSAGGSQPAWQGSEAVDGLSGSRRKAKRKSKRSR